MLRYLNIEVALGVVALAVLAARTLDVHLLPTWYVVVPLVTWSVYTLDRLLDTRTESKAPDTGRHRFHAKHRRPLAVSIVTALVVAGVTAQLTFPVSYWLAAVPLAVLTALHLLLQRSRTRLAAVLKDVNVVVTYTTAAWALPFVDAVTIHAGSGSFVQSGIDHINGSAFAASLALVLMDVILLSKLDVNSDEEAGLPSVARALSTREVGLVLALLQLTVAGIAVFFVMPTDIAAGLVLLGMAVLFGIVERRNVADPDTARVVIDAILLLPLALACIPR